MISRSRKRPRRCSMRKWICLLGSVGVLIVVAACGGTGDGGDADTQEAYGAVAAEIGIEFDPGDAVIEVVKIFQTPPDGEVDATLLGEGALQIDTTDDEFDVDSLWTDSLDVDDDGDADDVQLVYDDEDGILYAYAVDVFDCLSGEGTADAGILMGIYDDGNAMGAPEGSGWYVVGLDAGECAAEIAVLWGCEFDPDGNETACGTATLDKAAGTVTIARTN
jgi:hypothetical protein